MDTSAFDTDATLVEFLDEARANIDTVNHRLLEAERGSMPAEAINEMFRGAHSLKGLAGMFNLSEICRTTHALETVFDRIRKGELGFTTEVIAAGFEAVDLLGSLFDDLASRNADSRDIEPTVLRLHAIVPGTTPASALTRASDEAIGSAAWSGIPEGMLAPLAEADREDLQVACDAGLTPWLLRLPVQEMLHRGRDLVGTWRELDRVLRICTLVPIPTGDHSPWLPLDRFDYQVAALVLVDGALDQAVAGLLLPRFDAWHLDLAAQRGTRKVIHPAPSGPVGTTALTIKEGMGEHLSAWLAETGEELQALDKALLALERSPDATEHLQAAFRMAHRIKGSAAAMGLDGLARVAHNLEWALDLLRTGRLTADSDTVEAVLAVRDWIGLAVEVVRHGDSAMPADQRVEAAFAMLGERAEPAQHTSQMPARWRPTPEALAAAHSLAASGSSWHAVVELRHDCRIPDLRCRLVLSHLKNIATVIEVRPTPEALAGEVATARSFSILCVSRASEEALLECLHVDEVLRVHLAAVAADIPSSPQVTPPAAAALKSSVQEERSGKATAPAGPAHPPSKDSVAAGAASTVRVEVGRLDQLMNIAGELVVAKARIDGLSDGLHQHLASPAIADLRTLAGMVVEQASRGGAGPGMGSERMARVLRWIDGIGRIQSEAGDLVEAVVGLHRVAGSLQASAMQMRMVPVAPLFQRFHRVVRDLCRDLGKQAQLSTSGEATELDKKLIDDLVDPLTHLLRNALDHGLEPAAERTAVGKPAQGEIRLEAFQEGGQICIRVRDDGRGIDAARIRAKAVEKGLFDRAQVDALSDQDAVALIFLPGFSTAQQVSNVSGRGVGMDIVKSKIAELKGTVDIQSTVGQGSAFTIRLPLTLAMIKALLVEIGGERLALPLDAVREIVEVEMTRIHHVEGGGRFLSLRERIIAVADLPQTIGLKPCPTGDGAIRAVITKGGREPIAVPVDRVLREEEIVVKALPEDFARVQGLAGASILGDGGIALILDVSTIIERSMADGHVRR